MRILRPFLVFYLLYLPPILLASYLLKLVVPGPFAGEVFTVLAYAYYPVYLVALAFLGLVGMGVGAALFLLANPYAATLLPLVLVALWVRKALKGTVERAHKPYRAFGVQN